MSVLDDPAVRRDLEERVAAFPPLADWQRVRLRVLLRPDEYETCDPKVFNGFPINTPRWRAEV
ncbi:MAG TPA: hypothetical protein VJT31_04630 [Rugosimonospora sp.]|nr:hypothetical protein [Rugosimonospora sp.]